MNCSLPLLGAVVATLVLQLNYWSNCMTREEPPHDWSFLICLLGRLLIVSWLTSHSILSPLSNLCGILEQSVATPYCSQVKMDQVLAKLSRRCQTATVLLSSSLSLLQFTHARWREGGDACTLQATACGLICLEARSRRSHVRYARAPTYNARRKPQTINVSFKYVR